MKEKLLTYFDIIYKLNINIIKSETDFSHQLSTNISILGVLSKIFENLICVKDWIIIWDHVIYQWKSNMVSEKTQIQKMQF